MRNPPPLWPLAYTERERRARARQDARLAVAHRLAGTVLILSCLWLAHLCLELSR